MEQPELFTHRNLFGTEGIRSLVEALLLLSVAFVCQHFATSYALEYSLRPTSTYVGDLLLDNLPVVNMNFITIEVALFAIVATVLYIVIFRPHYILFALKAVAIFIIVRAFFISLTHMGIYPGHIVPGAGTLDDIYSYFNMQTGFFFSGHTGLPFLMALIFWKQPVERCIFLFLSFIFAVAVLLAHTHYSIDVFAAPFMVYGIFKMAHYLFLRDYKLIRHVH